MKKEEVVFLNDSEIDDYINYFNAEKQKRKTRREKKDIKNRNIIVYKYEFWIDEKTNELCSVIEKHVNVHVFNDAKWNTEQDQSDKSDIIDKDIYCSAFSIDDNDTELIKKLREIMFSAYQIYINHQEKVLSNFKKTTNKIFKQELRVKKISNL